VSVRVVRGKILSLLFIIWTKERTSKKQNWANLAVTSANLILIYRNRTQTGNMKGGC